MGSAPRVHLLASIDHVNGPLLWDRSLLNSFNWTWHNVATVDVDVQEARTTHFSSAVQRDGITGGATRHILRSLTPNHIRVLRILADHQRGNSGPMAGLTFHDLYTRCREEMLVNSDFTLRSLLTEFQDHELVTLHAYKYVIAGHVLDELELQI